MSRLPFDDRARAEWARVMRPVFFRPAFLLLINVAAFAAEPNPTATRATADYVPDVPALATPVSSDLREMVERFVSDRRDLERFYNVPGSALRARRLREFFTTWLNRLGAVDFEKLGVDGRIDATLLRTRLAHELRLLDREEARAKEMAAIVPVTDEIARLQESRRLLEPVDAKAAAAALDKMKKAVDRVRASLEAGLKTAPRDGAAAPSARDGAA
ncbi:MAG: hypothetical protein RLZZ15_3907, partial [Verrucomicrobiota bacterium]